MELGRAFAHASGVDEVRNVDRYEAERLQMSDAERGTVVQEKANGRGSAQIHIGRSIQEGLPHRFQ